jgi:hypothetical protein
MRSYQEVASPNLMDGAKCERGKEAVYGLYVYTHLYLLVISKPFSSEKCVRNMQLPMHNFSTINPSAQLPSTSDINHNPTITS